MAEDHQLRGRQGPGDAQVRRRVHLLRPRRRLSRHQVGAGIRARDQRAGRRSPLDADAGPGGSAGAGYRHSGRLSGLPDPSDGHRDARRRGNQDQQTRRQLRDRARPDRRSRAGRGAVSFPDAQVRLAPDVRHRAGQGEDGGEPGLLRPVRTCADLQRAAPGPPGGYRSRRHPAGRARSAGQPVRECPAAPARGLSGGRRNRRPRPRSASDPVLPQGFGRRLSQLL